MSIITKKKFGCLKDGREAFLYTIQNRRGTALTVCDYGGHMQALKTQKQNGMIVDVVLGYDDMRSMNVKINIWELLLDGAVIGLPREGCG
ncbi:hypothetical protein [Megasphaera cerevisiae]|uniref:hypothetical protein n=1 Tax=Megasphaera cerevisiae TaxID=39029 RepID=UPI001C0E513E|nr:hypothetical protein [Megasphaera cerevisiae]